MKKQYDPPEPIHGPGIHKGESWGALVAGHPGLSDLEPDVEALLANRLSSHREHYRAPIDTCFELVGLIRGPWRGLSGGDVVWRELDAFFERLNACSEPLTPHPEGSHA